MCATYVTEMSPAVAGPSTTRNAVREPVEYLNMVFLRSVTSHYVGAYLGGLPPPRRSRKVLVSMLAVVPGFEDDGGLPSWSESREFFYIV